MVQKHSAFGAKLAELAMYQGEVTSATDPQLRAFAQARVGVLQETLGKQPAPPKPAY